MTVAVERAGDSAPLPPRDWRDDLIASYAEDGFMIGEIIPQPPDHPVEREQWSRGGVHEFTQTTLPYTSMDDVWVEVAYELALQRNKQEFGETNVRVAFPTASMEQRHPEYAERPHHVIMVRPGGLL